jgi:hypothetical protein
VHEQYRGKKGKPVFLKKNTGKYFSCNIFFGGSFQLTRKTVTEKYLQNNAIHTAACNKKANRKPKRNKRLLNRPDCGKTILYCASIFLFTNFLPIRRNFYSHFFLESPLYLVLFF